jgi:chromate transporter
LINIESLLNFLPDRWEGGSRSETDGAQDLPTEASETTKTPITLPALFLAWAGIGFQSFGGGQSTLSLIQRKLVAQNGWITADDFAHANAISSMAPGVNLLAITILIGLQLAGPMGIVASLAGLLIPSIAVTIAMTAGYAEVRNLPPVVHAFHAIVPATVGIGCLTAWTLCRSFVGDSIKTGSKLEVGVSIAVIAASAILVWFKAPVFMVLIGGGILMGVVHACVAQTQRGAQA